MNNVEKDYGAINGYGIILGSIILLVAGIAIFSSESYIGIGILCIVLFFFSLCGYFIVNPNEAKVLLLFGTYKGTVKKSGLMWVNPFFTKQAISLRAMNLNGEVLKVNDSMGNPIEIAAVIVWQVADTVKAVFAVDDFQRYVSIQSEAAVRHLAGSYPYDNIESGDAEITLRGGGDKVAELLEGELSQRLSNAGIHVIEARISHLAYAPEIASAMLQRQQASAVVAARK